MARRAQRTGRAHLRVPVDEMIFAVFYRLGPQATRRADLVATRHFWLLLLLLAKVTRSARDWLRRNRLDRFFTSAGFWRAPEG